MSIKADFNPGTCLDEFANVRSKYAGRIRPSDGEMQGLPCPLTTKLLHCNLEVYEHGTGMSVEKVTSLRKREASWSPGKQGHSDELFQRQNLAADGALRYAHLLGGPHQIEVSGGRVEGPESVQRWKAGRHLSI